jgi:hypothetical protein
LKKVIKKEVETGVDEKLKSVDGSVVGLGLPKTKRQAQKKKNGGAKNTPQFWAQGQNPTDSKK